MKDTPHKPPTPLRVLVACEFSGVVRSAFRELGHEAWSNDLLPPEDNSPHHIQGDAINAIKCGLSGQPWDIVCAHPPCTFLANSGVRWLYRQDGEHNAPRWHDMHRGAKFFVDCWEACEQSGVKAWAFENPVMHKHARGAIAALNHRIPSPAFYQPWEHGHPETKKTGLYLHNLPPLKPSNVVFADMKAMKRSESNRVHFMSPGADRWKERSRTLPGVAKAIATQFSAHLLQSEAAAS